MTNIHEDRNIIKSLGGATALALKLNYQVGRVQNWTVRGIPPAEKLKFPHLFLSEEQKLKVSNS